MSYEKIKGVIHNKIFDYVLPFSQPLISIGIEYCVYRKLIEVIKESGDYDFIIVDADAGFTDEKVKLISMADKVIMVLKQNTNSVNTTKLMVQGINNIDNDRYIFVCNDYDEKEDSAIECCQILKTKIENYIGHIVDYDRKKCSGIARESGIEKISYLII